jgi:hypothetical protein
VLILFFWFLRIVFMGASRWREQSVQWLPESLCEQVPTAGRACAMPLLPQNADESDLLVARRPFIDETADIPPVVFGWRA